MGTFALIQCVLGYIDLAYRVWWHSIRPTSSAWLPKQRSRPAAPSEHTTLLKHFEIEILLCKWAMLIKRYFIKKFDLLVEKMTLFSDLIPKIHFWTNKWKIFIKQLLLSTAQLHNKISFVGPFDRFLAIRFLMGEIWPFWLKFGPIYKINSN